MHSTQERPATAVVTGQCRCSADADVQFYGFQINILFNLSIIYQHFSMQSFRDDLHVPDLSNIATRTGIFHYLSKLTFKACRNGP